MVKQKNRYALVEVLPGSDAPSTSTDNFTSTQIFFSVLQSVTSLHGDYGAGAVRTGLMVKVVDGNIVLFRLPSDSSPLVLSSLPFVRHIQSEPVALRLLFTGMSIRSCEKRLISMRRKELSDAVTDAKSPEERQKIVDAIERVQKGTSFQNAK